MSIKKRCFVIMPFGGEEGSPEWNRNLKIYQMMIKPAVVACGYECIRADELEHAGSITSDIIEYLHSADLVVADLSGKNANVFYELGVRHALFRCGTILIIRQGEKLPFDIVDYRVLFYSSELGGPDVFKQNLKKGIKALEKVRDIKIDNPVHNVLQNKLSYLDPENYVLREKYAALLEENQSLKKERDHIKQIQLDIKESENKAQQTIQSITEENKKAQETIKNLKNKLLGWNMN